MNDQQQQQHPCTNEITVLSYNIWFDPVHTELRMQAVVDVVQKCTPDAVLFQEVTTPMLKLLLPSMQRCGYALICELGQGRTYGEIMFQRQNGVWHSKGVIVRMPFENSTMGRCLQVVEMQSDSTRVLLSTAHLESLASNATARHAQLQATLELLRRSGLPFVFGGDTNLGAPDDRKLSLANDIADAWVSTGSDPSHQHTWDTFTNNNLNANFKAKTRFDRFYCDKRRVIPLSFSIVGKTTVPNIVPHRVLFPSDHWGIVARFRVE